MTYNKDDFIREMAKKGYTLKACNDIVDDFIDTMKDILVAGDSVQFRGFGAFEVRMRKGHQGRSPATGEIIDIPESKGVHFTAGSLLKREVREGRKGK